MTRQDDEKSLNWFLAKVEAHKCRKAWQKQYAEEDAIAADPWWQQQGITPPKNHNEWVALAERVGVPDEILDSPDTTLGVVFGAIKSIYGNEPPSAA